MSTGARQWPGYGQDREDDRKEQERQRAETQNARDRARYAERKQQAEGEMVA